MTRIESYSVDPDANAELLVDALGSTADARRKITGVQGVSVATCKLSLYVGQDRVLHIDSALFSTAAGWHDVDIDLPVGAQVRVGSDAGAAPAAMAISVRYEET